MPCDFCLSIWLISLSIIPSRFIHVIRNDIISFVDNYKYKCKYTHISIMYIQIWHRDFPCSSVGRESACNAGDLGLIPGWWRSPGEGNGNPLHYPCLENPKDRGAWQATVHRVTRVEHDLAGKTLKPPNMRQKYKYPFRIMISFYLDVYSEVGFLDHRVVLFF